MGRVCCCYSLPYSICTIVHRNYMHILVVSRYRMYSRHSWLESALVLWDSRLGYILYVSSGRFPTLKLCRMYNVFGLGASLQSMRNSWHNLHWQTRTESVPYLRCCGTQMALWFYAMMRLIRLQQPLNATIHQQKLLDLSLTTSTKGAVRAQILLFIQCCLMRSWTHSRMSSRHSRTASNPNRITIWDTGQALTV